MTLYIKLQKGLFSAEYGHFYSYSSVSLYPVFGWGSAWVCHESRDAPASILYSDETVDTYATRTEKKTKKTKKKTHFPTFSKNQKYGWEIVKIVLNCQNISKAFGMQLTFTLKTKLQKELFSTE